MLYFWALLWQVVIAYIKKARSLAPKLILLCCCR